MIHYAIIIEEHSEHNLHVRPHLSSLFRSWRARIPPLGRFDLVSTSFQTLCYTLFHFLRKIWYKFFDPFLWTNENRRAHKNTSKLSGCHRQSKQWIQLKILSFFRGMSTNIIKKISTIGLSIPAKLKNSRYFLNTPRMFLWYQLLGSVEKTRPNRT